MTNFRYKMPVNGVAPQDLATPLKESMKDVAKHFPSRTGIIVFAFDFGEGGGMAYISNARRDDCINALEEWIAYARRQA
jgi:hypothetical protein